MTEEVSDHMQFYEVENGLGSLRHWYTELMTISMCSSV